MKYNLLGKSDLKVSEVSFGCMSLGENHEANAKLLHQALNHGINFFDTADLYQQGQNEVTVGKAFAGMRDKVIIATKVGNQLRPNGSGWDWNPTKQYILTAVEQSLQRLQTDYIDLYQLHGGTLYDPIDETIEAFELLRQQGKIRYYGISSIRPNVIREYVKQSEIVSVMMQYSLLDRRPEESCLELLQEHTIGVLARGSLAKGLLVDKAPVSYLNHSPEEVKKAADLVHAIAGTTHNAAHVAVKYVLQHPAVSSAVLGIRTPQQLTTATQFAGTPALKNTELEQLQKFIPAYTYEQHR